MTSREFTPKSRPKPRSEKQDAVRNSSRNQLNQGSSNNQDTRQSQTGAERPVDRANLDKESDQIKKPEAFSEPDQDSTLGEASDEKGALSDRFKDDRDDDKDDKDEDEKEDEKEKEEEEDDGDDDDKKRKKDKERFKKARKNLKRAERVAKGGVAGGAMYLLMKIYFFIKMLIAKLISMAQGFLAWIAGIFTAAVSFISSVLSVSVTVAVVIFGFALGTPVILGASLVSMFVIENGTRRDGNLEDCVPSVTKVSKEVEQGQAEANGSANEKQLEMAKTINSIVRTAGGSAAHVGGILGNFEIESHIDATTVETIYTEPYFFGPRKQDFESKDYKIELCAPNYSAELGIPLSIVKMGIGFGQWTDTTDGSRGNTELREYAKANNRDWYDPALQLQYMFSPHDSHNGALKSYMGQSFGSPGEAALYFAKWWEGNTTLKQNERQELAVKWTLASEEWAVDKDMANSILSASETSVAGSNSSEASYHKSDGCDGEISDHYNSKNPGQGIPSETGNKIVDTALKYLGIPYVWGGTTPAGFDCSGLTQYVYRENGINISRVTTTQEFDGEMCNLDQLAPGDLVFWGPRGSTHHVGIFMGDGKFIHAPTTGDVVKITEIAHFRPDFGVKINTKGLVDDPLKK